MPMNGLHTIMLPVRGDGKGDNVLAHAAVLARQFAARVRVVNCAPRTSDVMPFGVVIPQVVKRQIEAAMSASMDANEAQLLSEFRALAAEFGLTEGKYQAGTATARFMDFAGKQVDAVKHYGRLADLICVPQPDPKLNLGFNTLKSALFTSGRPVMMCPPKGRVEDGFADHVAIAWNGSIEATRAVAMSMPVISSAKTVTILSGAPKKVDPSPEDLQRYLELKGVNAGVKTFEAKGDNVGTALLQHCEAVGAGTLAMGAYHESYERESLFGGNSQAVVENATIPVILVH